MATVIITDNDASITSVPQRPSHLEDGPEKETDKIDNKDASILTSLANDTLARTEKPGVNNNFWFQRTRRYDPAAIATQVLGSDSCIDEMS